jgi:glucokinase
VDALYAAVDLGGTNLRAVAATLDGEIRGDDRRPSRAEEGLEACLGSIDASIGQACSEAGIDVSQLGGLGIATPGWVDVVEGVVPAAPQLPGWRNVPLVRIMKERLGIPLVVLENDASAAALGENVFGAGQGVRHLVYITVSTGIGGGIVIDGKLYGGARGSAGEIGHTVIDPAGPLCGCGNYGCLEALASGTAIARRAEAVAGRGDSEVLARIKDRDGRITAEDVAEAAEAGDGAAAQIYAETGRFIGVALANLVNLLSPELILLGGGVTGSSKWWLPQAEDTMQALALGEPLSHVRLAMAGLGDNVGVMGMLARLRADVG